jgi:2'-5' RNA ligase
LPGDPAPPAEPFETSAVTLYRSTLRPQGALYEPLARTVAGDAVDRAARPASE